MGCGAFVQLSKHIDASAAQIETWRFSIDHRSAVWTAGYLTLSGFAFTAHITLLAGSFTEVVSLLGSLAYLSVFIGTALVWIVMTAAIAALTDNARLFYRLARTVPVNLLRPERLTPFASVAVSSTLAVIGTQAAYPILWLGSDDGLLAYRDEIAHVSDWPFDTGIITRLGVYLIIPPLTWIGAALIENVIDALL